MKKQLLALLIIIASISNLVFAAESTQQSLLLCSSDKEEPFDAHCEVVSLLNGTKKVFETGDAAEGRYQAAWSALHGVLNGNSEKFVEETKAVLVRNLKACTPERNLKDPIYRCFGIENFDGVTVQLVKQKFDELSERAQNIQENQDFFAERMAFVNSAFQDNKLKNTDELMRLVRQARHQFLSPFGIAMYKACQGDAVDHEINTIAESFKSSCKDLTITSQDCNAICLAFPYLKQPTFDFENFIPAARAIIEKKLPVDAQPTFYQRLYNVASSTTTALTSYVWNQ